jgi:hypothetical protein
VESNHKKSLQQQKQKHQTCKDEPIKNRSSTKWIPSIMRYNQLQYQPTQKDNSKGAEPTPS